MGRRKEILLQLMDLSCRDILLKELSELPLLKETEIDVDSITLKIRPKKANYKIKDIDGVITHLLLFIASDSREMMKIRDYLIVDRKVLAGALGVTDRTIVYWLQEGIIGKIKLEGVAIQCYELNNLLEQLRKYKKT